MKTARKIFCMTAIFALLYLAGLPGAQAASQTAGVDWSNATITVEGTGVAPARARNPVQARMMARRAAVVDAYRQIAEQIKGVNVDAETTVEDMEVTSDVVRTKVKALVQGARIIEEHAMDGGYVVRMQIGMYGASDSLSSVVFPKLPAVQPFPLPVPEVVPAPPVTVQPSGQIDDSRMESAESRKGSSAAKAPSGSAVGIYTGLIVDCRGLGLKPVMSPVIKNEMGTPIYGYKNLDYDKVVKNGMAAYTTDISYAKRAGERPLIVRAISLDGANPVLSTADANRVLIENGATGFLDRTNVVFVR